VEFYQDTLIDMLLPKNAQRFRLNIKKDLKVSVVIQYPCDLFIFISEKFFINIMLGVPKYIRSIHRSSQSSHKKKETQQTLKNPKSPQTRQACPSLNRENELAAYNKKENPTTLKPKTIGRPNPYTMCALHPSPMSGQNFCFSLILCCLEFCQQISNVFVIV
jgi:hypothetical protein